MPRSQLGGLDMLEWSSDALERLEQLRDAREYLDIMIEAAVCECRKGRTGKPIAWGRIAGALRISRQAAWEKYRPLD